MADYRDLVVWQKAYALALVVYQATRRYPRDEAFGLTSQSQRAAVSIAANIAEGHCRHSRADYLHFVSIARGSAAELETLLSLARDLAYLDSETSDDLASQLSSIRMMLTRLAQSLRTARA